MLKSTRQLTSALHKLGMPKEISVVRGKGYFYFYGPGTEMWPSSSVWAYCLNDLTVDGWLQEYKNLSSHEREQTNDDGVIRISLKK